MLDDRNVSTVSKMCRQLTVAVLFVCHRETLQCSAGPGERWEPVWGAAPLRLHLHLQVRPRLPPAPQRGEWGAVHREDQLVAPHQLRPAGQPASDDVARPAHTLHRSVPLATVIV